MSYVYALSSTATSVFHVADEQDRPACGAKIRKHHREVSGVEPTGWRRCKRCRCEAADDE